uniref:Uncharacterized protein n=1 Tax=Sphaerodactylus townsendi TaxID=933632 RepID=A0ACB8G9Y7_9SAUR
MATEADGLARRAAAHGSELRPELAGPARSPGGTPAGQRLQPTRQFTRRLTLRTVGMTEAERRSGKGRAGKERTFKEAIIYIWKQIPVGLYLSNAALGFSSEYLIEDLF